MSVNGTRQKIQVPENDLAGIEFSRELKLLCWAYEMEHRWNRLISEAIWIVQRDQFATFLMSGVCVVGYHREGKSYGS